MAPVLFVSPRFNFAQVGREVQALRNLGIKATIAMLDGTGSSAFAMGVGSFDPTSAYALAYLRQFDAVQVLDVLVSAPHQ